MDKYNLGGQQPARDDDNQNRTSSVILFGKKGSNNGETKAETKSVIGGARSVAEYITSSKTFGGNMGKPGTEFTVNDIVFLVLDKK